MDHEIWLEIETLKIRVSKLEEAIIAMIEEIQKESKKEDKIKREKGEKKESEEKVDIDLGARR